jgi:MFS family permease
MDHSIPPSHASPVSQPSPLIATVRSRRRFWAATLGLGITQLIGWGATFTAIGILGVPISRDLALPREAVFGGISIMLLVSAVLAPEIGRRIDRDGARSVMVPGTLVGALALLVIASAHGPLVFWLGWSIFGIAVAMAMNNAAVPALVDIAGADSRRAVSAFTIITGLTGAFFLPLTSWLEQRYGWRVTLMLFSLSFLVISLPIHLAVLPHGRLPRPPVTNSDAAVSWEGAMSSAHRRAAFWLVALWMTLQGFIVWGFNVQVIDILQGAGLPHTDAVYIWTFSGPSQALVRLGDLISGGRTGIMLLAVVSATSMPLGLSVVWLLGLSLPVAGLLAIASGAGQGLHAVARSLVPLHLFGLGTYGATMGKIALPLNLCNAASPLVYALLIARVGAWAALAITAAAALLSLAAILILARLDARAAAVRPAS